MITDLCKKTIFGKYKVLKLIEKGAFGYVFKAKNILTNELVALKAEDWKIKGNFLESEAYILYNLRNFGIPEIKTFGTYKRYKILVQTLLGESIGNLILNKQNNVNLKDICMLAIQLLDRLEFIHSKYIIHCDLKPGNLLVDLETGTHIYLIDFGFAKKYRSGKTKKHIKYSIIKKFTGTLRYSSVHATKGAELSRRDDLESAGYVLIYLAKNGFLPWIGLKAPKGMQRYLMNYRMKKKIKPEVLCDQLPKEFCSYMEYVKKLKFEEDPDYNYLRWLFNSILISNQWKNDLHFSWVSKSDIKQRNYLNPKYQKDILSLKKKETPHKRILRNIENSKEKENIFKNSVKDNNIQIIKENPDEKYDEINKESKNMKIKEIPLKNSNHDINRKSKSYDKNNAENQNDAESQKAQFKVDINYGDYSEETKYKKEIKENSSNLNEKYGDKFNLEEFRKKNYININYISIYNKLEPKRDKNINNVINNSLQKKVKPKKLNNSVDNTKKNPNVNLYKNMKINIIKGKAFTYKSPKLVKLFQKKIVKITNNKPILNNMKIKKIGDISLDERSNLESKKNQINKLEIPRKVKPFKNKINDAIKKLVNGKKINIRQINLSGIRYNQNYNNTNILTKIPNSRREPINYNKMNIKKSSSERRINSHNKNKNNSYNNKIPSNIIKTFSYKKIFNNSISINENSISGTENVSKIKISNYPMSDYQSVIKKKYFGNKNNKYFINNKILTNFNIIKIKSSKNNEKNKQIKINLLTINERQYSDKGRQRYSNSNDYKINNIKISQIFNEKIRKNLYKIPKNIVKIKNNRSQVNVLRKNINIKQQPYFHINNYLNNNIRHIDVKRNHNDYFTNKINSNKSY